MVFRDRIDAGRRLAEHLESYRSEHPVVVGMARGGVPVAAEVARRLEAALDVLVVRKVGLPGNPEFAVGALAGEILRLDQRTIGMLRIPQSVIDHTVAAERETLRRREEAYHTRHGPVDLQQRTVILIDDGLATGMSAQAAIAAVRARGARQVVFAAPVCAPDSAAALRQHADQVACLLSPPDFRAVGLWYDDFSPTGDHEVLDALAEAEARGPGITVDGG